MYQSTLQEESKVGIRKGDSIGVVRKIRGPLEGFYMGLYRIEGVPKSGVPSNNKVYNNLGSNWGYPISRNYPVVLLRSMIHKSSRPPGV